ncbi:MAG TPA: VWA domain-containing protein [Solirubrobacteraceae bacterium]|nr:VWA domain-containing protein [Solirubrobacteraceae bacterium]
MRRLLAAFLVAACVPALHTTTPAAAQSPPAGTPKILLAFDASGSMAADDGAGTPKIDAAQDAAVDLLGSLPPSTQVGLRVFGGTKPSRPIGPACRDSSLVLPIGPLDRAQAEQQIRSFRAKGRTPIAYALERAAEDLGTSGPRTIILVSDGKDTCQPPSPCQVAQRIAKGGVEMRIQAIGFNVDRSARRELQCIAKAGGGVYTDADNAATLKEQLRVLSTRALRQYVPRGKPVRGGPTARQATTLVPGRYVDGMLPDSERWYAVELRRGETLKASASFIPPKRDIADHASLARASLDIVTPSFDIPDRQNSSSSGYPFQRRGFVDGFGVVSRPIGVGAQADPGARFSQPGRYYLKLALKDTDAKDLFNATGGQPYPVELAVEVLGRHGGAPAPSKGPQPGSGGPTPAGIAAPNEPPATALLVLVGGGLAAVGFAGGVALRRRRAG